MSTTMVISSFFVTFFRQIGVGELLVLDALLNVLVVEVELLDAVVGAEARIVAGDDVFEGLLLGLGSCCCLPVPAADLPGSASRRG